MSAADGASPKSKIQNPNEVPNPNDQTWDGFTFTARQLGIELAVRQLERFRKYEQLLREWNARVNLVSRKDLDRLAAYHFLDSLTAASLIPQGAAVCDVGSGGGLPGIPLKIARDDISLVLVESIRKKALFLEHAVRELGLERATVRAERAEAIRDLKADVVVCRLVGKTAEVARWVAGMLKPGGRIILYKSATVEAELKLAQPALHRLHLRLRGVRDFPLPFIARRLVVLERAGDTRSWDTIPN
jgi:16S rRNA (guanine527-N7)-methyltransferase